MKHSLLLLALLASPTLAFAQAANGDVVANGNFNSFVPQENLWDGVDAQNCLAGTPRGVYAVMENGTRGSQPMPLSVNFIDVNGDKLPDLVTADPAGVLRAYINSGTPTAPKFTLGEVIPIYPPQVAKDSDWGRGWWTRPQEIPKLALYDWRKRGTPDLIFGNYTGDMCLIPNSGSAAAPAYAQPAAYEKTKMAMTSKHPWGNLFAPCVYDWNKDGKLDLLIGEGTYSANAVYVLLNQSSGTEGKFTEEERHYLCYGDGREQLVPTVADWNGDGEPDVIVGDRLGQVGVYVNPGNWKPGVELPLATMISFGAEKKLGMPAAPHACDFNGDGLFDLLIGKGNGRVAVAINKGTKTEPKFDAAVDLKGENLWSNNIRIPNKWTIDPGNNRGNLYAYTGVGEEPSPGGGKILKSGYFPSPNKVFKMNELSVNGRDATDFFRYWAEQWEPMPATWAGWYQVADAFLIRQNLTPLKVGTTYQLTFKVKGVGIREGQATVAILGANENVATKFTRGERGSVKPVKDEASEEVLETVKFTSSKTWTNVEKTFAVHFKGKGIKALDTTTLAILEFKFQLPQYLAECEICDVQLVPKGK
jgi:hypothetical protein